jgi:hypothetical protein
MLVWVYKNNGLCFCGYHGKAAVVFLVLDDGNDALAHLLPVDCVGVCVLGLGCVVGCRLVVADSASGGRPFFAL